ncbi:MAG TPA: hypothetical protein PLK29_04865, partial [Chiayiivirga sp.]|nr:hypothetical protein [Chiayiivirga sp.]
MAAAILFIPARMRDLLQRHALHRIAEHALRQPHPPHAAPAQLAQDAVLRHLRHGQRIPGAVEQRQRTPRRLQLPPQGGSQRRIAGLPLRQLTLARRLVQVKQGEEGILAAAVVGGVGHRLGAHGFMHGSSLDPDMAVHAAL